MNVEYTEDERKHLEFVQDIITRMNRCSFQLKQWMVTLVAAILGLSISVTKGEIVLVALFPILMFWLLDAYYLHQERKYRGLYKDIINRECSISIYDLNAEKYFLGFFKYICVVFSRTMWPLYFSTLILVVTLFILMHPPDLNLPILSKSGLPSRVTHVVTRDSVVYCDSCPLNELDEFKKVDALNTTS